ncbi:MAG: hypothetical protein BGP13_19590 [Sphingobacteriales bacterium 40-81]|nr:MAG: hypothetical protein BGP13_19590 [Sphingobacteriales bacterium 40-81]
MFFYLDAKEPKVKALMPLLKMDCVPLKCKNSLRSNSLHFFTPHFTHFLNAHASRPFKIPTDNQDFLFNIIFLNQYFSASIGMVFFEILMPQDGLLRE